MDFKKCIVESGKKLEGSGFIIGTWGNINIYDPETGLVYLTLSTMRYSATVEDDVVVCRLDGTIMGGHRRPTIETGLHLTVYRDREEVNAAIHTHPMYSMAYATQGKDIPLIIDEAAQAMGGTCKCIQCAPPGSEKPAAECEKALGKEANSYLLHSHGAACAGESIGAAFKVVTVLETATRILYMIKVAGRRPAGISPENVAVMKDFTKSCYRQGRQWVIKRKWKHKRMRNIRELES